MENQNFLEVTANDFIAEYIGQTAEKTYCSNFGTNWGECSASGKFYKWLYNADTWIEW